MTIDAVEMLMLHKLLDSCDLAQIIGIKHKVDILHRNLVTARAEETPMVRTLEVDMSQLRVGDQVIFIGRKTKPPVIGTIKSMNDKTYTITGCSDGGPGWRMPPSMLRRYEPGVQPIRR